MIDLTFGRWLSRQRKLLGLTQKQIAQQMSCAAITVRKIEAEQRRPSVQIVEQLSRILDIPSADYDAFLRFARGYGQPLPLPAVLFPSVPKAGQPNHADLFSAISSLLSKIENPPDENNRHMFDNNLLIRVKLPSEQNARLIMLVPVEIADQADQPTLQPIIASGIADISTYEAMKGFYPPFFH